MAETEYSTSTKLPILEIWDFVRDMDNWASFVTGYQGHEKHSDSESLWTVKGDVGVLARSVQFRVNIVEWAGPERVRFTLLGLNEQLEGEGEFSIVPFEDEQAATETPTPRPGLGRRLVDAVVGFLYRMLHGRAERGAHADAGPGAGMARLTFRLRVDPGGPTAPMVDAMLKPALRPAAEDLANRIVTHLEQRGSA